MDDSPELLVHSLYDEWADLLPQAPHVGTDLLARYADPARVYHDVRHLADVLARIEELQAECRDVRAVRLAGWFHDAVYEIGNDDNEAASATLASTALASYVDAETVNRVRRLVVLTRDHQVEAGDTDGAVLCDADLAVLAGTQTEYDEYARRVRIEYATVPDDAFRTGRRAILQALLALPAIFSTNHGLTHWESAARHNLERELSGSFR